VDCKVVLFVLQYSRSSQPLMNEENAPGLKPSPMKKSIGEHFCVQVNPGHPIAHPRPLNAQGSRMFGQPPVCCIPKMAHPGVEILFAPPRLALNFEQKAWTPTATHHVELPCCLSPLRPLSQS
jgi:hypothetical protein